MSYQKLVIFIPAYNEEKTIGDVIRKIPSKIENINSIEVIVINDGSTDKTAEVSRGAGAFVISHKENLGLGLAFKSGIEAAMERKADIAVNIDGDGQFDSADIPKLIQPLFEEADLAIGSRFVGKRVFPQNMPKIKVWGNKIMSRVVSRLSGRRFYDATCGFRSYSREAMLNLNLFGKFTYTQEVLLDLSFKNFKIIEVPVEVKYFSERKSELTRNLFNYSWQVFKIILKTLRDYKPLKFFGITGVSVFLVGLVFDILILSHFLRTGAFTPYKSIAFIGGFFNALGIGIFVLGLLADMLLRIKLTQERSLYYQKRKLYYGD